MITHIHEDPLFGNSVALNPGQGGVRDVASAITSHEQTEYNRICYSQTLDDVFPTIFFFQSIQKSQLLLLCRVVAQKRIPVHRYCVVIFTFHILWDWRIKHFYLGIEQRPTQG